jgi:hypothetical protein
MSTPTITVTDRRARDARVNRAARIAQAAWLAQAAAGQPMPPTLLDTRLVRAELARLRGPAPATRLHRPAQTRSTLAVGSTAARAGGR